MIDLAKFKGVFPAFLACYDEDGNISAARTQTLAEYCISQGANGLYITGSSGEFVYQTVDERKMVMKSVMEVAQGRVPVIAHVGASSTRDSVALAQYARACACDAISSVPPFYFSMPPYGIMDYWNAMIDAAQLPFILYNIPATTGINISYELFSRMLENPLVIGIKNTSMPVMDIQQFKKRGGDRCVVFNGPDEQFVAGCLMGADGGIGSTYTPMLPLYLQAARHIEEGAFGKAVQIQRFITDTICEILALRCSLMPAVKELVYLQGVDTGPARLPQVAANDEDRQVLARLHRQIDEAQSRFCG